MLAYNEKSRMDTPNLLNLSTLKSIKPIEK